MARRNRNHARSKAPLNSLFLVLKSFNLIAYILIKIGEVPIWCIRQLFLTARSLRLPKFKVQNSKFKIPTFNFLHRRRGRPRTQPLPKFYLNKFNKSFKSAFPKPTRIKLAVGVVVIFLSIYTYGLVKLAASLPSPYTLTESQNPLTTQIYDRNGKLLYQFYEGRNRKLVSLNDLPPHLINAVIAMEDKNFYSHPGIDIGGLTRALITNVSDPTQLQGGSTITQQLIKNTLLTPDRTFGRKVKEVILAFWAEWIYTKPEILQAYLNEAPFGGPAWGIQAAAEMYFGKDAKDLTLSESSFLAGLPASPTQYSPYGSHPNLARDRQKEVLRRMVEDRYISPEAAEEAYAKEIKLKPLAQSITAPHFVMYVREVLAQKYGERVVSQGGLKVVTTLDQEIQNLTEAAVAENIKKLSGLRVGNGAAMVQDVKTGHILSMVGSKNYFDEGTGNFNVTLALRQPGSSIKPVTYVTAFKNGYTPGNVVLDTPVTFSSAWERYSPVNYDGKFHGAVSIRTALGSSYNIPAVKMLAIVGIPEMMSTAHDLGINTLTDPSKYGLSLTLGGGAVKMIEMMSVYNTFATNGVRFEPQPLLTVTDSRGNLLEDHRAPVGRRVLTEEVAYLITHILSDKKARVPAFGPNSLLEIPNHNNVAVKTGTSDDKRDNWAFGYSAEYVVGTWVGNNDNSPMDPRLTSGITGATPIWHDIMRELTKDRPDIAFRRPKGIIDTTVDGHRDLSISGSAPKSIVSLSKGKRKEENGEEKEVITYTDPFSRFIPQDTKITQ